MKIGIEDSRRRNEHYLPIKSYYSYSSFAYQTTENDSSLGCTYPERSIVDILPRLYLSASLSFNRPPTREPRLCEKNVRDDCESVLGIPVVALVYKSQSQDSKQCILRIFRPATWRIA